MANPDFAVKNGTIEGIRRIDEILAYVSRYFDNDMVTLGPGVTGKAMAQHLKSSNGRLRPFTRPTRYPHGFPTVCV